jgi:hypothetical protein
MESRNTLSSSTLNWPRLLMAVVGLCAGLASQVSAQGWPSYSRDPQHSAQAIVGSQLPQVVRWHTPVDLAPPNTGGGDLYIHYGSPVITRVNSILVPVKTTSTGNYRVEAHKASTGTLIWSQTSDYQLPSHNWVPIFGITLTPKDRTVVFPGAGGTIYARSFPDSAAGTSMHFAFYDTPSLSNYTPNATAFNSAIQICTPISSDILGNVYFGFVSSGAALPGYPNGIPGGLAKITPKGVGSFVSAAAMSGDSTMEKVAYNCAPAFSADGSTLYVAVNNSNQVGYLCALNTTTLARQSSVFLLDPRSTVSSPLSAWVNDDGSATPTVGPDSDVYYGVLEANFPSNHARGFLLHFDSTLATTKLPSAFGWDDTASIVPATAIPSYTGPSTYLLLTKYNNYADPGIGGTGVNLVAVVDPNVSEVDPISGATVMSPVITVAGVTPDTDLRDAAHPNAVREWCINSAAIDVVNKCAVVNSEDGKMYRWDFVLNQLSAGLMLEPPTGEAYTPTVIGPDGAIYGINNANLFSCIAN